MASAPFTCVVADDHEPVLEAVTSLLRSEGVDVVGRATNGTEAVRLVEQKQPAVLVLDIRLPELSGLDVARRVAELSPRTAVLVHTSYADTELVREALAAGARAVVLKSPSPENLLAAFALAVAGGTFVDPALRGQAAPAA